MSIDVAYLAKEDIWVRVENFRRTLGEICRNIPVEIFDIIDFDLEITLVPRQGLQDQLGASAYLTVDCTQIAVDQEQYMGTGAGYRRARFSGAIEVGHLILHKEIIQGFGISSLVDWEHYASTYLTPGQYDRISMQAIEFAGRLMVPKESLIESVRNREDILINPHFKGLSHDLKAEGLGAIICDDFELTKWVLKARILNEKVLDEIS